MKHWIRTVATGLATVGLLGFSVSTWAANIPNYDMTMHRTRLVHGSTENATDQLYSTIPVYLQIPAGTTSFSTPNVIGSTAYQYTFSGGGIGYLSALALPNLSYQTVKADATKNHQNYVIQSAQYVQSEVEFYAGTGAGVNYASGQSSLSTGPVVKGFADGTQYQAIAVGKYLYSWPQSSYGHSVRAFIQGNYKNADYQVDDSPLITPPVTVHGAGGTSWQSPVAVIGSWDGGLVATPVDVPAGDVQNPQYYTTSQTNPGGIGTTAYPHSTADITSDPTWVGSVPGLGADCVAFGIAGGAHPRVILFNVTTGQYKAIGVGEIGSGISDTTLFDDATGTLYVQDLYGVLYAFSLSGALKAVYGPSSWTSSHMILGQDMALVDSTTGISLYAVGGGGNVLGQFSLGLKLEKSSGRFGPDVSSPAFLTAPSNTDSSLLVISNAAGNVYLRGDTLSVFSSETNQYDQAIGQSKSPPWAGYLPDAGVNHDLIGWTNSDPNGDPAVVVYVPEKYSIAAMVDTKQAITLSKAVPVTITGIPSPSGVTYDDGNNNWTPTGSGGGDPVEYKVTTPAGVPVTSFWQSMNHTASDQWQGTWTPPVNTTTKPITYDITVEGADELGQTAQASVVTVTVNPTAPVSKGPTAGTGGSLTLACGWGNGTPDITQSHSCTIPGYDSMRSARWFVNNPQIGVKFGDTIDSTLTIPPPKLPALSGLQIESVVLDAKIPYREGFSNQPGQRGYVPGTPQLYNYFPGTVVMTPQGSPITTTAKGFMLESWAGWPPPTTQQGLSQGDTITLTAEWTAHVTYSYLVYTATGVYRKTAYFTYAGTASAPVTVNGTDYYIIWTPQGY